MWFTVATPAYNLTVTDTGHCQCQWAAPYSAGSGKSSWVVKDFHRDYLSQGIVVCRSCDSDPVASKMQYVKMVTIASANSGGCTFCIREIKSHILYFILYSFHKFAYSAFCIFCQNCFAYIKLHIFTSFYILCKLNLIRIFFHILHVLYIRHISCIF